MVTLKKEMSFSEKRKEEHKGGEREKDENYHMERCGRKCLKFHMDNFLFHF